MKREDRKKAKAPAPAPAAPKKIVVKGEERRCSDYVIGLIVGIAALAAVGGYWTAQTVAERQVSERVARAVSVQKALTEQDWKAEVAKCGDTVTRLQKELKALQAERDQAAADQKRKR